MQEIEKYIKNGFSIDSDENIVYNESKLWDR